MSSSVSVLQQKELIYKGQLERALGKVAYWERRMASALKGYNAAVGFESTFSDAVSHVSDPQLWSVACRVRDAVMSHADAVMRVDDLRLKLASLEDEKRAVLAAADVAESYASEVNVVLGSLLGEFKRGWLASCEVKAEKFWRQVRLSVVPKQTAYIRTCTLLSYFVNRGGHSRLVRRLMDSKKALRSYLARSVVRLSEEAYVYTVRESCEDEWRAAFRRFCEGLQKVHVDLGSVEVAGSTLSVGSGLEVVLRDKDGLIDCRCVVCAEMSDKVCTHLRYYVTRRRG